MTNKVHPVRVVVVLAGGQTFLAADPPPEPHPTNHVRMVDAVRDPLEEITRVRPCP